MTAINSSFSKLKERQTELALNQWRTATLPQRPRSGWVRAIRTALGMSSLALAKRLGLTEGAIRAFEASEVSNTITLASLQKLANAMGCDLRYALVPRESLSEQVRARARERARELLIPVAHSMSLEAQSVSKAETEAQIEILANSLIDSGRRKIW